MRENPIKASEKVSRSILLFIFYILLEKLYFEAMDFQQGARSLLSF